MSRKFIIFISIILMVPSTYQVVKIKDVKISESYDKADVKMKKSYDKAEDKDIAMNLQSTSLPMEAVISSNSTVKVDNSTEESQVQSVDKSGDVTVPNIPTTQNPGIARKVKPLLRKYVIQMTTTMKTTIPWMLKITSRPVTQYMRPPIPPFQPKRSQQWPWTQRRSGARPMSAYSHVCTFYRAPGKGFDKYSSWYFNVQTNRCEWFLYRGWKGNANRFTHRGNCEAVCVDPVPDLCARQELVYCQEQFLTCKMIPNAKCIKEMSGKPPYLKYFQCPPEQPMCVWKKSIKPYSFKLMPFMKPPTYLTNRQRIPDECKQSKDPGMCETNSDSELRYFYNDQINDCLGFLYSKCGGNSNRFNTKQECMNYCAY